MESSVGYGVNHQIRYTFRYSPGSNGCIVLEAPSPVIVSGVIVGSYLDLYEGPVLLLDTGADVIARVPVDAQIIGREYP